MRPFSDVSRTRALLPALLILAGFSSGCVDSPTATDAAEPIALSLNTASNESVTGMAADFSGVFVGGWTSGALDGRHRGGQDAFVRLYHPEGEVLWSQQFGSTTNDVVLGVAAGQNGYSLVAVGYTEGSIGGSRGLQDAFVRVYMNSGTVQWTKQFGTTSHDRAVAAAADNMGNVYVVGWTDGNLARNSDDDREAFIRKYSFTGQVLWTRQYDMKGEGAAAAAVAATDTVVYVAGTSSSLGLPDATLHAFSADSGTQRFARSIESVGTETVAGIGVTATRIIVAGTTTNNIVPGGHLGGTDIFVRGFRLTGAIAWTRQFGTAEDDEAGALHAAPTGGQVLIAGNTWGEMAPGPEGGLDAFLVAIGASTGAQRFVRQYDSGGGSDDANAVVGAFGYSFLGGSTDGAFVSGSLGGRDGFVMAVDRSDAIWIDQ